MPSMGVARSALWAPFNFSVGLLHSHSLCRHAMLLHKERL